MYAVKEKANVCYFPSLIDITGDWRNFQPCFYFLPSFNDVTPCATTHRLATKRSIIINSTVNSGNYGYDGWVSCCRVATKVVLKQQGNCIDGILSSSSSAVLLWSKCITEMARHGEYNTSERKEGIFKGHGIANWRVLIEIAIYWQFFFCYDGCLVNGWHSWKVICRLKRVHLSETLWFSFLCVLRVYLVNLLSMGEPSLLGSNNTVKGRKLIFLCNG